MFNQEEDEEGGHQSRKMKLSMPTDEEKKVRCSSFVHDVTGSLFFFHSLSSVFISSPQ